jgi:hypothetical protein
VPEAAALGDDRGRRHAVLHRWRVDHAEHRHELLLHEPVRPQRVQVGRQRREQDLGVRLNRDPGPLGELGCGLAERGQVHLVPAPEGEVGQAAGVLLR